MNNPYQEKDPIFNSPYIHERVDQALPCLFMHHNIKEYVKHLQYTFHAWYYSSEELYKFHCSNQ
jgi:hypothetical protein